VIRIDANALDYAIIAVYFVVVIGIGLAARRLIKTGAIVLIVILNILFI
jgi:hypothetical protein